MPGALVFDPFAVWRLRRLDPALCGRPLATLASGRVVQASVEARRAGVRPGMGAAAARLACRELILETPRPADLASAWEALLGELYAFTPWLEPLAPGRVLFRLTPAETAELAALHGVRGGAAANRELALVAALGAAPGDLREVPVGAEEAFLERLPLYLLRGLGVAPEALERAGWLGVASAGELRRWSPAQLRAFFGAEAAVLAPVLHGPWSARVARWRPPAVLRARLVFDDPVFEPRQLEPALARLAETVTARLAGRVAGRLQLTAELRELRMPTARLAKEPLADAGAVRRLAWRALETGGAMPLGIEALTLELAALSSPLEQGRLWRQREARERAAARVERRFPGAVATLRETDPWALAPELRASYEAAPRTAGPEDGLAKGGRQGGDGKRSSPASENLAVAQRVSSPS